MHLCRVQQVDLTLVLNSRYTGHILLFSLHLRCIHDLCHAELVNGIDLTIIILLINDLQGSDLRYLRDVAQSSLHKGSSVNWSDFLLFLFFNLLMLRKVSTRHYASRLNLIVLRFFHLINALFINDTRVKL